MRLKRGVRVAGVRPELMIGLMVAESVYREFGYGMTLTSIVDGAHSETSLHYSGAAADLRTKNLAPKDVQPIAGAIRQGLGTSDFDVVVEKTHIHLEWQPKRSNR